MMLGNVLFLCLRSFKSNCILVPIYLYLFKSCYPFPVMNFNRLSSQIHKNTLFKKDIFSHASYNIQASSSRKPFFSCLPASNPRNLFYFVRVRCKFLRFRQENRISNSLRTRLQSSADVITRSQKLR